MTEPTTEAGRALLDDTVSEWERRWGQTDDGSLRRRESRFILAIEAQARAAEAAAERPEVEALRHLFFVLERLDRQATDPSPDHMVKITREAWLDMVRPAIQAVRSALDAPGNDR